MHLSYIAHSRKDYKESLALCESAKEIYESLGELSNNAQLAHVYTGISYSLSELDRNEEALAAGAHAIELLEQISSPDVLTAYRAEGRFAFDAKRYEDSIAWYAKALAYVTPDESDNNRAWDYFYIGRAQLKIGQNEDSITNFKLARDLFKEAKNLRPMAYCDEELALAYINLNQLEFAKTHASLALDFAVTSEDEVRQYWSKIRYATACLLGGEYQEAFDNFYEAKSWEVKESKYCFWPHVFALELKMADCVEGLGDLTEATEIRRRISALAETLGVEPEMP